MKRLIMGAAALVAAWFFGLIALSVLGIIMAIAIPNLERSRHIGAVHGPSTVDVIHHEMVGITQPHDPVATQVVFDAIKSTGLNPELTALFVGAMFLLLFLGTFAILWRLTRRASPRDDADSGTVQELYHLGKNLDKRMEALETILLERSRPIS
jgi:hypothetical protein